MRALGTQLRRVEAIGCALKLLEDSKGATRLVKMVRSEMHVRIQNKIILWSGVREKKEYFLK